MANNLITPDLNYYNSMSSVTYAISNVSLEELAKELNTQSWSGVMNSLFNNLSSYIASLRVYPINFLNAFSASTSDARQIHIGKATITNAFGYVPGTGTTALFIPQAFLKRKMCTINIQATNFTDFLPYTSYDLYLPYFGTYTITDNTLLNKDLEIYYTIDILTGKLAIDIVYIDEDNTPNAYIRLNSTIGMELPILSNNTGALLKKLGTDFFSSIASLASYGMSGSEKTLESSLTSSTKMLTDFYRQGKIDGSFGSEYLMWYLPQHPVLFKRKMIVENFDKTSGYFTDDYLHLKGQSSEKITILDDLDENTFFSIKDIHLDNINASGNELQEIENLLKSGVIK